MNAYVYRWILRPRAGLDLELQVTAPNVIVARREIRRFLVDHDGGAWAVEGVTREITRVLRPAQALPSSHPTRR